MPPQAELGNSGHTERKPAAAVIHRGAEMLLQRRPRNLIDMFLEPYVLPFALTTDGQLFDPTKPESLQIKFSGRRFSPLYAIETLRQAESARRKILAIHVDTMEGSLVSARDGQLQATVFPRPESSDVAEIRQYLTDLATVAQGKGELTVGFMYDRAQFTDHTKASTFQSQRHQVLDKFFPDATQIDGDDATVTSLAAATVAAHSHQGKSSQEERELQKVLYLKNDTTVEGGIWEATDDGTLYTAEPGHIPLRLSEISIQTPNIPVCGKEEAPAPALPCVESIMSKAGIISLYRESVLNPYRDRYDNLPDTLSLDPDKITEEVFLQAYKNEDSITTSLLDASAALTAIAITGLDRASKRMHSDAANVPEDPAPKKELDPKTTAVVLDGSMFEIEGYKERVEQYLMKSLGYAPNILYLNDISKNPATEGAALLALTAEPKQKQSTRRWIPRRRGEK